MPITEDILKTIQELAARPPHGDRTSTLYLHPNDLERFRAEGHDDSTDALRTVRVQASRLVPPGNVYATAAAEYLGQIVMSPTPPLIEVMNLTNRPITISGIAGGTFMGGPFIPGEIVGVAGMQDSVMPETAPQKSRWALVDEEDPEEDVE